MKRQLRDTPVTLLINTIDFFALQNFELLSSTSLKTLPESLLYYATFGPLSG